MKKLIAGNWKMNLGADEVKQLCYDLQMKMTADLSEYADFLICPSYLYVGACVKQLHGSAISVGVQDCSAQDNGAHTGDVSASMAKDIGASHVILGHSERRADHGETDDMVQAKAVKVHEQDLIAVICVGETEAEREAGKEKDVVKAQVLGSLPDTATSGNTVIAYEPVWAIGTGKTASAEDAGDMHVFIRSILAEKFDDPQTVHILYGGSMKPANAADLLAMPNIDGGLVGGASLKADSFLGIAQSAIDAGV